MTYYDDQDRNPYEPSKLAGGSVSDTVIASLFIVFYVVVVGMIILMLLDQAGLIAKWLGYRSLP